MDPIKDPRAEAVMLIRKLAAAGFLRPDEERNLCRLHGRWADTTYNRVKEEFELLFRRGAR